MKNMNNSNNCPSPPPPPLPPPAFSLGHLLGPVEGGGQAGVSVRHVPTAVFLLQQRGRVYEPGAFKASFFFFAHVLLGLYIRILCQNVTRRPRLKTKHASPKWIRCVASNFWRSQRPTVTFGEKLSPCSDWWDFMRIGRVDASTGAREGQAAIGYTVSSSQDSVASHSKIFVLWLGSGGSQHCTRTSRNASYVIVRGVETVRYVPLQFVFCVLCVFQHLLLHLPVSVFSSMPIVA